MGKIGILQEASPCFKFCYPEYKALTGINTFDPAEQGDAVPLVVTKPKDPLQCRHTLPLPA
jgi:hypothetical protein